MVKYLLGLLSGIVLVFFLVLFVVVVAVAVRSAGPAVEPGSVLVLPLQGDLPEHLPTDFSVRYFPAGPPPTLLDVRDSLKKAAQDVRIRAVVLRAAGLQVGWGKAQELRSAIHEFKKSGKPILAFLQVGGTLDYYVASAADRLAMTPEGILNVKGLRAEVAFLKDTLGKLGIEAEMEQIGKYKTAAEPLSRSSMSDAYREVVNSMLDEIYGQLVEDVAASRDKTVEEVRNTIDRGPFISEEALASGLVDELQFEDQFFQALRANLGLEELKKVSFKRYRKVSLESLGLTGDSKIAVVFGIGGIQRGRSETDPVFGSMVLASDSFSNTLKTVREDEDIEAVIVRINSPGGDAIASDQIWREMNLLEKKKPLVISMSDVAASGGYYIAMTDAPILAYGGTITGSIGVVYGKLNLRGLYDKIGMKKEILTRGHFAAIDSDYRPLTLEEREKLHDDMEALYRGFVAKVTQARGGEWEEIHEVARGRVWMGSQAIENGLVDETGGFDRAIALAKEQAGVPAEEQVTLELYPRPKSVLEVLLDEDPWNQVLARDSIGLRTSHAAWRKLLGPRFGRLIPWSAFLEGGMMQVTPYWVAVQ